MTIPKISFTLRALLVLMAATLGMSSGIGLPGQTVNEPESQILMDSISIYKHLRQFHAKHRCESLLAQEAFDRKDISQFLYWHDQAAITLGKDIRAFDRAAAYLDSVGRHIWCTPDDSQSIEAAGWLQFRMAFLSNLMGDPDGALQGYENVNRMFQGIGLRSPNAAKEVFKRLGNLYTRKGDHERAGALLHHALRIFEANHLSEEIALVRSDLGVLCLTMEDPDAARRQFYQALSIPNCKPFTQGIAKVNYGILMMEFPHEKDSLKRAEQFLLGAKSCFARAVGNVPALVVAEKLGEVHQKLGDLYALMGYVGKAKKHYRTSIRYLQSADGNRLGRLLAKTHIGMGKLEVSARNPDSALQHFQHGLQSVLPDFHPLNAEGNPDSALLYPENSIMEALVGKADAFWSRYLRDTSLLDLRRALDCHLLAGMVEDTLQADYLAEPSRLIVAKDRHQRTERVLAICLLLWRETGSQSYLETAFDLTERTKAALLRERILQRGLAPMTGPLTMAIQAYRRIRNEMEWLSEVENPHPNQQDRLLHLQDSCSRLRAHIQQEFPEYHTLCNNRHPIALKDLRSVLGELNQTLLEYFVGDSLAYVLVIDSGSIRLTAIEEVDSIRSWAEDYRIGMEMMLLTDARSIMTGAKRYAWAASRLYSTVLRPIETGGKLAGRRLVVVPDGPLHLVNFAALLRGYPVDLQRFGAYPYLCADHLFTQACSSTLYAMQATTPLRPNSLMDAVALAPTTVHDAEVPSYQTALIKVLHDELGYKTITGKDATKSRFVDEAKTSQVIVLIAHNDSIHASSHRRICFSDGQFLTREELHYQSISLNAMLMVMLNCGLSQGDPYPGEGMQSQSTALFAAGCPSVIAPNSNIIESKATYQAGMIAKAIAAGKPKDVAVNEAYLSILQDTLIADSKRRPSEWAGLVLWGDPRPVAFADRRFPVPWIPIACIGASLLAILIVSRMIRQRLHPNSRKPAITAPKVASP